MWNNVPTGPSIASGGIIVESGNGVHPVNNTVQFNTAYKDKPFDISYDGTGSGDAFNGNHCSSSSPSDLCR